MRTHKVAEMADKPDIGVVREHPDMMSASEGGGRSWKSGSSKGGCMNFILYKSVPNADKRGGGQKIRKFSRHHIWKLQKLGDKALFTPFAFAALYVFQ